MLQRMATGSYLCILVSILTLKYVASPVWFLTLMVMVSPPPFFASPMLSRLPQLLQRSGRQMAHAGVGKRQWAPPAGVDGPDEWGIHAGWGGHKRNADGMTVSFTV